MGGRALLLLLPRRINPGWPWESSGWWTGGAPSPLPCLHPHRGDLEFAPPSTLTFAQDPSRGEGGAEQRGEGAGNAIYDPA